MSTRISVDGVRMRKRPRQARSRVMVGAIVDGAARVLQREGWRAFTTNRVAEAAGVSVGSLYQFFPDKGALLQALRRRHFDAILAALDAAAASAPDLRVARLVDGLLDAHADGSALLDDAPAAPNDPMHASFEHSYVARFARLLAAPAPAPIAARVLAAAVEGVTHEGARQGLLGAPAFRDEVRGLIGGFLGRATRA